jgi:hypothetical protein
MTTTLDPDYFSNDSWRRRVEKWLRDGQDPFDDGNLQLVRQIMEHAESGLRVVVNISAHALLSFLAERRYRNLYESPVIGGTRQQASPERQRIDTLLELDPPDQFYFGAVALGGTGVRFYGEYCIVLQPSAIDANTQVFDRDSYDLLLPPLANALTHASIVEMLRGKWEDVVDMLTLKLLPELRGSRRLVTTGTVSEMILRDQEFVEVHKRGAITVSSIEELRQSPDEVAIEARIAARSAAGFPPTAVELRWLQRRDEVVRALEASGLSYRIVTLHGRGYQWRWCRVVCRLLGGARWPCFRL